MSVRIPTLLALVALLTATPALAVDKCKVKQGKEGTLFVSASDVSGTLRFGYTADRVTTAISGGTCIASGTAKDCVLGDEGTDARTTLPP